MNKINYSAYYGYNVYKVLDESRRLVGFSIGDENKLYGTASDCYKEIEKKIQKENK
jgi:hypothetical protein